MGRSLPRFLCLLPNTPATPLPFRRTGPCWLLSRATILPSMSSILEGGTGWKFVDRIPITIQSGVPPSCRRSGNNSREAHLALLIPYPDSFQKARLSFIRHPSLLIGPPHAAAGLAKRTEMENTVVAAYSTGRLWRAAAIYIPGHHSLVVCRHARPLTSQHLWLSKT